MGGGGDNFKRETIIDSGDDAPSLHNERLAAAFNHWRMIMEWRRQLLWMVLDEEDDRHFDVHANIIQYADGGRARAERYQELQRERREAESNEAAKAEADKENETADNEDKDKAP